MQLDRADNFIKRMWQVHEWSCHFNDITCLSQFHANLIYFGQSCSNAHFERRNFIVSPTLWVVFRRLGMKCFLHLKPVTRFTKLELNKPSECWIPTFSISGNLSTTSTSSDAWEWSVFCTPNPSPNLLNWNSTNLPNVESLRLVFQATCPPHHHHSWPCTRPMFPRTGNEVHQIQ